MNRSLKQEGPCTSEMMASRLKCRLRKLAWTGSSRRWGGVCGLRSLLHISMRFERYAMATCRFGFRKRAKTTCASTPILNKSACSVGAGDVVPQSDGLSKTEFAEQSRITTLGRVLVAVKILEQDLVDNADPGGSRHPGDRYRIGSSDQLLADPQLVWMEWRTKVEIKNK